MTMKKHFLGMKKNNIFLACIFVLLIGIAVAITVYSLLNDKILFIFLIWILVVIYIVIWVVYFSLVTIDNENITISSIRYGKRRFSWKEIVEVDITYIKVLFVQYRIICLYREKLSVSEKRVTRNAMSVSYGNRILKEIKKHYHGEIATVKMEY